MELRVIKGLLASLALHFLLVVLPSYLPEVSDPFPKTSQVEIEIRERPQRSRQQLVREALVPEKLKVEESVDPLTFLSNQRQRVKTQTRAPEVGMTANRSALNDRKKDSAEKSKSVKNLFQVSKNGTLSVKREEKKEALNTSLLNMPRGLSTTGESMPQEMQVGSFTALNTDRYLYYSFFARVEEIIRYPWENSVRWILHNTPRAAFQSNISANWITHVDIVLKPNGEFHTALLLKESGIRGFDVAATRAFAQAKLFPNPPIEMIEDDGFIHLRYRFNVRVDPRMIGRQ